MENKELDDLKIELLANMKLKKRYPIYRTTGEATSQFSARELEKYDNITKKNIEKHDQYSKRIDEIEAQLEEKGYPIQEIISKWEKAARMYNVDFDSIDKVKLTFSGKKLPSLQSVIMNDIDLEQYLERYETTIENNKHK